METPQVNGKFFLNAMKNKRITMRELTKLMGLSHHAQISRTFTGERRMQLDDAIKFSEILGIQFEQVVANAGYPQVIRPGTRVRVAGSLNSQGVVDPVEKVERALAPDGISADHIAIQARTADTRLSWMDAWLFFCAQPSIVRENAIGRFCYAKIKDGPAVLATIRRGYAIGSTFNLTGPYENQGATLEWAEPILMTRN